jgi:hypothetical protein
MLNDDEFNRRLQAFAASTKAVLQKSKSTDFVPTCLALLSDKRDHIVEHIHLLVPAVDAPVREPDGGALVEGFGSKVRGETKGDLLGAFFASEAALPSEYGDERCVFIWGATADGRANGATIALRRSARGTLEPGEVTVHPHPTKRISAGPENLALRFVLGYRRSGGRVGAV